MKNYEMSQAFDASKHRRTLSKYIFKLSTVTAMPKSHNATHLLLVQSLRLIIMIMVSFMHQDYDRR